MSDIAISVENISKLYHIGRKASGSFRETVANTVSGLFSRTKDDGIDETEFWALKDISFNVKQGDVVGIIGKNGAGKSTLLKILSRITEPTTGKIQINGRVGSLLEVGTGFHPELSGRENIYLNGSILGMRRIEIQKRFDEIVEFSGIEKFIDTPVKRYSSGMYVRLAFAVAAHLEPEILIIDEVLAVGDAEFQKKCLGKMKDVSEQGRTIIFVSHNMGAVKNLCNKGLLLTNGKLTNNGIIDDVINSYFDSDSSFKISDCYEESINSELEMQITSVKLAINDVVSANKTVDVFDKLSFILEYHCKKDLENYSLWLQLSKSDEPLFGAFDISPNMKLLEKRRLGNYEVKIDIPTPLLKPGVYSVDFHVSRIGIGSIQKIEKKIIFDVDILSRNPRFQGFATGRPGRIAIEPIWHEKKID